MRSGNLVSGRGFAFIINGGHSLIGGGDYSNGANPSIMLQPSTPLHGSFGPPFSTVPDPFYHSALVAILSHKFV